MVTGSCLCGAVRWRIDGPFTGMTHCHCSMCRKAHGAPFATYAAVDPESVTFLAGSDQTGVFESSPGAVRSFCSRCGSVVPVDGDPEVPVGGLDGDPGARPEAHIFASFQAPWHIIADGLPRHDIWGEEMDGPVIDMPARAASEADVLHGSCLCNAIAYEAAPRFTRVHNCHCSRCRKARAAAHTTNGFLDIADLRFTRGEDHLRIWHLPGARYFAQSFCALCGSVMPRHDRGRMVAVIPFGSLDSDPGRRADDHVYVGSRASWYDFADHLARYDEMPP